MTPKKPERLRAVEEACVAQQRVAEAIMGLAAYEGADLRGALKELQLAKGRIAEAERAVRRAIIEQDQPTELDLGGGTVELGDLKARSPVADKAAQIAMAERHNSRADDADDEASKWSAA